MSGDTSEEKSLPASAKKLKEQRRKGKVQKGPDLQVAITSGALIAYLLTDGGGIMRMLGETIDVASLAVTLDFDHGAAMLLSQVETVLLRCALLPLLIAVAAAIVAGLLINKGFVFSLEPLKPKPEVLNPAAGIKNLYKLSNWVELGKSLVKALLFGGTLFVVARAAIGPLIEVPACSPACLPPMLHSIMVPLLGAACLFYLASGAVDMLVQRWLFLRDMRMTQTEMKRERKDTNGNPLIKRQQRRLRRENGQTGRLGLSQATLVVCGADQVVGLRYVRGETPLPLVVCRAVGDRSTEMLAAARLRRVPTFWDRPLTTELGARIKVGQVITMPFFPRVANAILLSGPG